MYIIQNGQIIRPEAPSSLSTGEETHPPQKQIFKTLKQVSSGLIILFFIYMLTCGKCKDVFLKLLR